MDNHTQTAVSLFNQGYNCAQAVCAAYCDQTGLDTQTALKISSSFGGGMGRMREVCGAVSGMFMVAGMLRGYTDPSDAAARAEHYKLIQTLAADFKAENGSIICRELLVNCPVVTDPVTGNKKPNCDRFVAQAAQILDKHLLCDASTPAE